MEKRTKELRSLRVESVHTVMDYLARALSGVGPAVTFGPVSDQTLSSTVSEAIAIVVTTTGSTGRQKEVALEASSILASARASNEFLNAHFGDTWSLLLPLTHIAGVNVLVRSLELGTTPIDLRNAIEYPKVNFTAIVPTQLFRALNGDSLLLAHLQGCKAVLVGGSTLTPQVKAQAIEAGIEIVTTYGMSETCGGCVYEGTPLRGVEIQIRDGYIKVKGKTLASTYLNDETAWFDAFDDGWFVTHDLGVIENNLLTVLGRDDEVFISGGENISLSAVEEVITQNYPSLIFAAFAMEDAEWGSALHLAIDASSSVSPDEISSTLVQTLGSHTKPKDFLRIKEIPLVGIGKVDRQALIELAIREKGNS